MADDESHIEELIAALDHTDKPTIRKAVDALLALATNSAALRDALNKRLIESGHRNYWPVAYVLGQSPQRSAVVIQTLLDTLDHAQPDIRWAIALLLVRIAKDDRAVAGLLMELCATGTANQKRMATYCIRDLALEDSESLAVLASLLSDSEPTVRVAAVTSLKTRADVGHPARKALLQIYLQDQDARVRNAAAVTLASFGSPAEEFVKALAAASKSSDAQTKKAADAALKLLQK